MFTILYFRTLKSVGFKIKIYENLHKILIFLFLKSLLYILGIIFCLVFILNL